MAILSVAAILFMQGKFSQSGPKKAVVTQDYANTDENRAFQRTLQDKSVAEMQQIVSSDTASEEVLKVPVLDLDTMDVKVTD